MLLRWASLTCFRIEDKERIRYPVLLYMEASFVLRNKIVIIKHVLGEIFPLGAIDDFKCYDAKLLNINFISFSFKSYFLCYGYSPPKYSLN